MRTLPTAAVALTFGVLASLPIVGVTGAAAQTKPMHSGHMSHGAPQMRRHGSGIYHPNRPHYHHHVGHHGYRPVYTHHPHHHAY